MVPMSEEKPERENHDSGPDMASSPLSGMILDLSLSLSSTPLVLHKSQITR